MDVNNTVAPVLLFVYNRPDHTGQTIEALKKNHLADQSDLFIFSDAPKNDQAVARVREVRAIINKVTGFKTVSIIERDKNWGLANSIIDGVTSIIARYGRVIVLEDDLVTTPDFLNFMNAGLNKYASYPEVYSLSGYSHSNDANGFPSTYFTQLTSSWGWGTWAEKWKYFKRDRQLLEQILHDPKLLRRFNFDDSYDYGEMIKLQLQGKIDSWAIYWYACVFMTNGLTLYPARSLLRNIGFDGSGVHCDSIGDNQQMAAKFSWSFSEKAEEEPSVRHKLHEIFLRKKPGVAGKFRKGLKKIKNLLCSLLPAGLNCRLNLLSSKIRLLLTNKKTGKNTFIDRSVQVFGWQYVAIGDNCVIGEDSWLNVNERIQGLDQIKIGNCCYFGRRNLFSSGRQLIFGDYVMTSNDCRFLGNNHEFNNPLFPYVSTGTTAGGTMKIGVNTWIGVGVTVLGSVTIGHGSVIGAGSVVTTDIPPFSVAVGNPCRVIKRYCFDRKAWVRIKDENEKQKVESLMPSEDEYLTVLQKNCPAPVMPIPAGSSTFGDLP